MKVRTGRRWTRGPDSAVGPAGAPGGAVLGVMVGVVVLLAGCAGPVGEGTWVGGPDATVRGFVVDAGMHPAEGVIVALAGTDRTVRTDAGGAFTFEGVAAGIYTVHADGGARGSTTGVALVGDSEGALLQLKLVPPGSRPAWVEHHAWNALVPLNVRAGPVAGAGAALGGPHEAWVPVEPGPDKVQAEALWEPAQGVAVPMALRVVAEPGGRVLGEAVGSSPLSVAVRGDALGDVHGLRVQFEAHGEGAAGMALDQEAEIHLHVFQGFLPPEGWLWSRDGEPPVQRVREDRPEGG